jgi:aminopeptidase-like protein
MSIKKYYFLAKKTLFPLNRSLTGKGIKQTLKIIKNEFPKLKIKKIKAGAKVFDWKIPEEWNISDAFIIDKHGDKIIDFKKNNLHVVGYSKPINRTMGRDELINKLFSLKKQPNAIPYITSYYEKRWGFCMSYNQLKKLKNNYKKKDKFKVVIKSSFNKKGFLNYGELVLKGKSADEILVSTYICHPSMANNELSGPIVSMSLINYFKKIKNLNKSIRFIFIPETIGSIAYIYQNFSKLKDRVIGGYNLSCIGDERNHSCILSKYENSPSDDSLIEAYKKLKIKKYKIYSFLKRASDERQFNSPGIDLKITSIFRTKYGEFPEYHTSLDNFNVVTLKGIKGGYNVAKKSIIILLNKIIPKNKILCEPQMGKRGLYPTLSTKEKKSTTNNYMNFLQYADGNNSIERISKKINLGLNLTKKIFLKLKSNNLVY